MLVVEKLLKMAISTPSSYPFGISSTTSLYSRDVVCYRECMMEPFLTAPQPGEDRPMQWNFTSKQVAQGEVDYSLDEFIDDLYREVRDNFPEYGTHELNTMSRLAYDVCYCTATRRSLDALLQHCREKGLTVDRQYLELIRDSNLDNGEMLKAIFARKVSEYVDSGLGSEEALKKLDEYHHTVLSKHPT